MEQFLIEINQSTTNTYTYANQLMISYDNQANQLMIDIYKSIIMQIK